MILLITGIIAVYKNDIKKIYCNATLDDDFAEDRILVVLNDKVSSILKYIVINNKNKIKKTIKIIKKKTNFYVC